MARPASEHPTDGELEILRTLWDSGPLGLGALCQTLREVRPIATTTVATMLGVMREKKLVKRRRGPRGYVYSAAITRRKATTGLVRKLVDRAFDGSASRLVAHLLEGGQLSAHEWDEVRRLLAAHPPEHRPAARKPKRKRKSP